jgi:hypothetical protein
MPSPAELLGRLVRFVGEILGASSLRFEIGPTLAILGVLLVFLQLVARPISRWVSTDAGGLTSIGRSMALAAESGTDVVVSLGGGGLVRTTDAFARLQTQRGLASRCGCSRTMRWPPSSRRRRSKPATRRRPPRSARRVPASWSWAKVEPAGRDSR